MALHFPDLFNLISFFSGSALSFSSKSCLIQHEVQFLKLEQSYSVINKSLP